MVLIDATRHEGTLNVLGLTWPWRVRSRPPTKSILNLSASLMISASTVEREVSCWNQAILAMGQVWEAHEGLDMAHGNQNSCHIAA